MEFMLDDAIFTVDPSQQEYFDYGSTYSEDDSEEDAEDEGDYVVKENNFSIGVKLRHGKTRFVQGGNRLKSGLFRAH